MGFGRGMDVTSIGGMIWLVVGIAIATSLLTVSFPLISDDFVSLSGLGNFTFASFFSSGGLMFLVLSAAVLIGLLTIVGIRVSRK